MATRPRGPGGLKGPGGTKLGRGAPALRPPSGSGVRKQSPLPTDPKLAANRGANRTPVKPTTPIGASNTATANGQQEFQVGDQVTVNGKTGRLAFLGNTQFAKGIWAGIVLDTKDGKNNGIVNGVQYFECEANRGLFARPEKLAALQPRTAAAKVKNQAKSSPAHQISYEVGDRVSVDGVKEGNIAFVGETQFSKGIWVGVILDSPDGKNNGTVGGIQYFECEVNYGLFSRPEKLTVVSESKPPPPHAGTVSAQSTPSSGFEVGDRVLVDGLKEGVVGFLGETQFARGVWAGVILDVPEGKNNGLVNDVEYFTCEPNHGLFTRLNKLQLISQGGTGGPAKTPIQDGGTPSMPSNPVTPVDLKILQEKLKVGDHVLVGGVKEGVLRFIGITEFAKGIWVGVELPGPMGKNDGAISGKRYFQCEPKHGLFAPLPKVEKLASAGSEGGLSGNPSLASLSVSPSPHASPKGAGFLRSAQAKKKHMGIAVDAVRSDSSVSSLDSSRVSQEPVFQEPVFQEPVFQEPGGLGDPYNAEAALTELVHERDDEIESLQTALDDREKEKEAHQEELTELRRQVDDLQFQLEEQHVISGDQLETVAESSTNQLTVISRQLEDEKKANVQLQEQIKALQSGLDKSPSLHNELTELQARLEERERQTFSYEATITDLREQVEEARRSSAEDHDQSQLQAELAESQTNLEADRCRLTTLEQVLTDSSHNLEEVGSQCDNLRKELEETKRTQQEESQKVVSLEQELGDTVTLASEFQGDLERSQRELEKMTELCGQRDAQMEEKAGHMAAVEDKMRYLLKEQELWASERSRLTADQERLIGERDQAMVDSSRDASAEQLRLNQLMQERETLLAQHQALQTDNDRLVSDREDLLHQVEELQQQKQAVLEASQHTNLQFSSAQGELSQARNELQQAKLEMASSREEWEDVRLSLTEQLELAKVDTSEAQRHTNDTASERDSALQKAQELAERLEKAESERDGMQLDLETAQVQVEELQFQLDELNTRHGSVLEEGNAELSQVQETLAVMEAALEEKDRELAIAQEKVQTLTDDLVASQGTRDLAMVEEEKALLEERVKELILQLEISQDKRDSEPSPKEYHSETLTGRLEEAQRQLLEAEAQQQSYLQEIEDFKQQGEFLNSVIIDLQNKLEGVEAMKGLHGHLGSVSDYAVDDYEDEIGLPPPRLFCDICDVFDEHDTDDCPLQATTSDSPPNSMYHGDRAPGGSDRPYCNTCEIFGHRTEDCEYEATY